VPDVVMPVRTRVRDWGIARRVEGGGKDPQFTPPPRQPRPARPGVGSFGSRDEVPP